HLRDSISFVLHNPGSGTYAALSVATTQVIMATHSRSFLPRTCTRQCQEGFVGR
ncbi:hypothetical protein M405DRAFT_828818, partial [Rhizopogon salebrosus TDB-379]